MTLCPSKCLKMGVSETWIPHPPLAASRTNKEIIRLLYLFFLKYVRIFICPINTYLDEMYSNLACIKVQKMQFFIYFFIIFWGKVLEAVTMSTGMQPKELGINHLVLCDNTKPQKVSSKFMTRRATLGLVVTKNCY